MADAPPITNTREALRRDLVDGLRAKAAEKMTEIESGPLEGIEVISAGHLSDALDELLAEPLRPPSEQSAEVVTPAVALVWAMCPRCHLPATISLQIEPELRVDAQGSEIRLRAKAKAKTHVCGQTVLDVKTTDGQEAFELENIVRPEGAVEEGDVDQEEKGEGEPDEDDGA
jgi:hypothetical protein